MYLEKMCCVTINNVFILGLCNCTIVLEVVVNQLFITLHKYEACMNVVAGILFKDMFTRERRFCTFSQVLTSLLMYSAPFLATTGLSRTDPRLRI